jgi:DNA-binding NtrC family response regulator
MQKLVLLIRRRDNKDHNKAQGAHNESEVKTVEMRTVLFVDNDKTVLRYMERCLRDEPHNKFFTNDSKEIPDILQQEKVHLIVKDTCSSDMEGHKLLRIAGKRK